MANTAVISLQDNGVGNALSGILDSIKSVAEAAESLGKLKEMFSGITKEGSVLGDALLPIKKSLSGMVTSLGGKGLALAKVAGIIAIVVLAVVGLIAWWRDLGDRNAELKDRFLSIWNSIRDTFDNVVGRIRDALSGLGGAFSGLWGSIAPVVDAIFYAFAAFLGPAIEYVINKIGAKIEFFIGMFTGLVEIVTGIVDVIIGIITGDMALISEGFSKIWEGIKTIFETGVNFIKNMFQAGLDFIMVIFGPIANWIYDNMIMPTVEFFIGLWDGIRSAFQAGIDFIVAIFSPIVSWIYGEIITPILNVFKWLWENISNAVGVMVTLVTEIFLSLVNVIRIFVIDPLSEFFSWLWDNITAAFSAAIDFIRST